MSGALIDMKPSRGNRGKSNRKVGEKRERGSVLKPIITGLGRALVMTLLLGSVWMVGISALDAPYFAVDEIRLENNQRLAREDILAQAKIGVGESIFAVDPTEMGASLMTHPWVASANVQRHFPRRVDIILREREPQAIVNLGYLYYVDRDGTPFKILTAGDALDFPAITGIETEIDQEETIARLKQAIEIIEAIRGNGVFTLNDLSEIHLTATGEITLFTTKNGVPIYLGSDGHQEKLARLSILFNDLKPGLASIDAINLELPGKVIVRSENYRNS